ncbi:MAG: tetratricopeptide repeat protein, partial [Rhodobacteraceae bacterium]|nr:tetratricopeptide repeat protein [Paracoccaceae bacterium]
ADANILVSLLNGGRFEELEKTTLEMTKIFGTEPFLFNVLGLAQSNLAKNQEAIKSYQWAIKLNPDFLEPLLNLGAFLVQLERYKDAEPYLRKCIDKNPKYAAAHHNLGLALVALERPTEAMRHYDRAIEIEPGYGNALNSRATLKKNLDLMSDAISDYEAALKYLGDDPVVMSNLSGAFYEAGRSDDSLNWIKRSLELSPENTEALLRYAIQLNEFGQFDESREAFGKVLKAEPNNAEALRLSLDLLSGDELDLQVERMKKLAAQDDLPEMERVHLGFGLGTVLERRGNHEEAYKNYDLANRSYRSVLPPPPETDDQKFEKITRLFKSGSLAPLADFADSSTVPVFVLGMMRSGTSLVEQILSSHSQVYGAGELVAATSYGEKIYKLGASAGRKDMETFVQKYLAALMVRYERESRVIDKMPGNFFNIGLLHLAFPNAKFVNLVRDPRDNCFSIYKNFFATYAHQYAYDQAELARFANNYKRMMNMWDDLFPGVVYHCKYEALVADQENESRKLLEYVGVPWEDQVLDFHKTKRSVRTASVNQVRKKIYKSSVQSWRNYAPYLSTLFDGLDDTLWQAAYTD